MSNLKLSTVAEALTGFIIANGLPPHFVGDDDRLKRSIDWYYQSLKEDYTEETFAGALQIAKRTTRGKFPLVSNFYSFGSEDKRDKKIDGLSKGMR